MKDIKEVLDYIDKQIRKTEISLYQAKANPKRRSSEICHIYEILGIYNTIKDMLSKEC